MICFRVVQKFSTKNLVMEQDWNGIVLRIEMEFIPLSIVMAALRRLESSQNRTHSTFCSLVDVGYKPGRISFFILE